MPRYLLLGAMVAVGCTEAETAGARPPIGPDCAALAQTGKRAQGCLPELAALVAAIQRRPSEPACREAIHQLLRTHDPGYTAAQSGPRSFFDRREDPVGGPLGTQTLTRLAALDFPATLTLSQRGNGEAGLATTRANIGDLVLEAVDRARLQTTVVPGLHQLDIEYAGRSSRYCVELRTCETVALSASGVGLSEHPSARPGPCPALAAKP